MGCCGKKIFKVLSIAEGNFAVLLNKIKLLPADRFHHHFIRTDACRECEHCTHLTDDQYLEWIKENGGYKKFLAEIDKLEEWKTLTIVKKENSQPGAEMFCSLCKCWLEAKAYVMRENCPIGNPAWREPKGLYRDTL